MQIVKLENKDKERALTFLRGRVQSSMFLLGNIEKQGLEYTGEMFSGDYWAAISDTSQILGILAYFWNDIVCVQEPDRQALDKLILYFQETVHEPVAGLVGDGDQIAQVLNTIQIPDHLFDISRREALYQLQLESLKEPIPHAGQILKMVPTSQVEAQLLFDWLKAYEFEALGKQGSTTHDEHINRRVEMMQTSETSWVLLDNGSPVSLSCFNSPLPEIVQVGPVWTPPQLRGKGYARSLVAKTLQQARAKGVSQSVLFTDNTAAAKAYEAIGYQQTGSYHLALLKEPQSLTSIKALV